jgi:hypothetical protein
LTVRSSEAKRRHETVPVRGVEHHTYICSACHVTERRVVFIKDGREADGPPIPMQEAPRIKRASIEQEEHVALLPAGFPSNPVLRAFTNAILHCPSCAKVSVTLKAASDSTEQQADPDNKVTSDFAACMTRDELKTAVFHDVAVLPHPKETILRAIEREILREQLAARLEWFPALFPTRPRREPFSDRKGRE